MEGHKCEDVDLQREVRGCPGRGGGLGSQTHLQHQGHRGRSGGGQEEIGPGRSLVTYRIFTVYIMISWALSSIIAMIHLENCYKTLKISHFLTFAFCAGVLGTVRGGCPVSGGDGRRGEGGSSPVQGRDARIGTEKHVLLCGTFTKLFLFQSLRALGSATSQRPEQSTDQVHEGAGGEGGGGAEEQWGFQQQPRPRSVYLSEGWARHQRHQQQPAAAAASGS